jgi:hypothetical protein
MKKFSDIIINESVENTYLLGKSVDKLPAEFTEILDLFQTFKESYSGKVDEVVISKGYVTISNLNNTHSVNSTQMVGSKKIRQYFKDGRIPDKWILSMKSIISFTKFKNESQKDLPKWAEDEIFDSSTIDMMIERYKAIKTLTSRCEYYGFTTKVSYGSKDKISILVFFK